MPTPDDEPDNLILRYLRRLDEKMDRLIADMHDMRQRVTALEIQGGGMVATEQSHYGFIMQRFDRHETRLERIERRLDIAEVTS